MLMKRFVLIWVVFSLFLALTLGFADIAANIPRNETVIAGISGTRAVEPDNFNVFVNTWRNPDRGVQQVMLEPLWMNEQALGKIINALAEQPPIYNEDFTKLTIKLRKGMYWSDGVEFTADDVVYGIKVTIENPEMSYHGPFSANIKDVYKTDDYTVVIELKHPNSRFHSYFIDRWGAWRPFPKHIFEKAENPARFKFNPPVSSGPYILKDYDPAGYWTLWEKRKDWDRTPTGVLFGEPKPRYVLFYYYSNVEQRVIAQLKHELDVAYFTPETIKVLISRSKYSRPYQKDRSEDVV